MTIRCSLSLGFASLALMVASLAVTPVEAAPTLTVTPTAGHPNNTAQVSGRGFAVNEVVDIYFATTDELLVRTNASGNFGKHALAIPADATPGKHWITAVGRRTGDTARVLYTVRTGWTQQGFSPDGQRRNPYENVLDVTNVNGLALAWTSTVNDFASPPVIAGGASPTAYVASKGKMNAFDAASGALRWSGCGGPGARDLTPAVANGAVYIGSNKFFACDAATGTVLWTVITSDVVTTSATVANGIVYFGCRDGKIYALNGVTGAVVWNANTGGPVYSAPTASDGTLFIGSQDRKVHAYDAATGAVKWATNVGSPANSAVAVAQGMVFAGVLNGKVYALDASSGAVMWSATVAVAVSPPAVANGTVFVASNFDKVYAFNATSGAVTWTANFNASSQYAPAVANGVVYFAADPVAALDATTGAIVSRLSNAGSSPVVTDGRLYFSSGRQTYAYALNPGASRPNKQESPPAVTGLRPDYHLTIAW